MRNKRTSFCFYVLLLLALLTGFEAAFSASGKDDDDNEQKQTIDLRKILQVHSQLSDSSYGHKSGIGLNYTYEFD